MGADLIAYICKGPQKLDRSKRDAAVAHTTEIVELAKISGDSEDALDGLLEKFGDLSGFEDLESVANIEPAEFVDSFIETWDNCDCRDMSFRTDPDDENQKIVVAGELSWGDTPEGEGYTALNTATVLGLMLIFGIR